MKANAFRVIRMAELLRQTGISKTELYSKIKEGTFVPSIQLGARSVGWIESEVNTNLAVMSVGSSNEEIRELVVQLVKQRSVILEEMKRLSFSGQN